MAERSRHHRRKVYRPGWKGLLSDLRTATSRLFRRSSTNHKLFVYLVLAVGALLRALRISEPVTYDEALTYVHFASRSFGFLFSDYQFTSNHILYSAFARISTLLFGTHLWSLRLPALLAGILAMPLFYAFARAVFNRHIAVIVLCLLAVSGPLVEYSALARGYSLTWMFMSMALLAARHFVKAENSATLVLLALACALGMWAVPVMIYPACMVYLWALAMLVLGYESTLRRRVVKLAGSFLLFIGFCFLCYAPVINKHGIDQLLQHPSLVEYTWAHFANTQQDSAFELWAYFTNTASTMLAFAGAVGIIYAAYTSSKYRMLIIAMGAASVPLVIVQHMVAQPAAWNFVLFVMYLGIAIGLFYLLKLVRDKLVPNFTKAQRTLVAGGFVLLVFGWTGIRGEGDTVERYPEAAPAAAWLVAHLQPGDQVLAQRPWDAPVAFLVGCDGGNPQSIGAKPTGEGTLYVLVGPSHGQTVQGVLNNEEMSGVQVPPLHLKMSWLRLELYSDR